MENWQEKRGWGVYQGEKGAPKPSGSQRRQRFMLASVVSCISWPEGCWGRHSSLGLTPGLPLSAWLIHSFPPSSGPRGPFPGAQLPTLIVSVSQA